MTTYRGRLMGWALAGATAIAGGAVATAQQAAPAAPAAPYVTAETPVGTGPFKAVMESDPSLPTHTIYHPADLSAMGNAKLPIVLWGNGACSNIGNKFRYHLSEIASHGFFAIAIGPIGKPTDELEPPPAAPRAAGAAAPAPTPGPPATRSKQLIDALDWAIAENARPGSKYRGKLDTTKIAAMGQSCGGVQAIEASADPRITTSGIWNSGLFPTPSTMGGGKEMTKDDLKSFHGPVIYVSGDESDIAFVNANDDFEKINHVPAFRAYEKGVGHNGTHRQPNGGDFGKVSVAWLKWQLKGDQTAAKMFVGADCTLCTDPKWVVKKKNIK